MKPFYESPTISLYCGDALEVLQELPAGSVHCIVTSPPYWGLRDYGVDGQIGLEPTLEDYIANLVAIFAEAQRVLRNDGTLWLNLGDSYTNGGRRVPAGLKPKDLCGVPWRVALALQAAGWHLRCDIIWSKPNTMPESAKDRPTRSHEYVFLLSKQPYYYFDAVAIAEPAAESTLVRIELAESRADEMPRDELINYKTCETARISQPRYKDPRDHLVCKPRFEGTADGMVCPMRNTRSVWHIPIQPFPGAHFATFPEALAERCILAGCPAGGTVLDPFIGSGTTAVVAHRLECNCVGIELNKAYLRDIAVPRIESETAQMVLPLHAGDRGGNA